MILNISTTLISMSCHPIVWLRSVASLRIVSFSKITNLKSSMYFISYVYLFSLVFFYEKEFEYMVWSLTNVPDKKNENKEVAVNDFLPAAKAFEAVQHSQ